MACLKSMISTFVQDESGQDLIEYALVAALIGLGTVASMQSLAGKIGNTLSTVGNTLVNNV